MAAVLVATAFLVISTPLHAQQAIDLPDSIKVTQMLAF